MYGRLTSLVGAPSRQRLNRSEILQAVSAPFKKKHPPKTGDAQQNTEMVCEAQTNPGKIGWF